MDLVGKTNQWLDHMDFCGRLKKKTVLEPFSLESSTGWHPVRSSTSKSEVQIRLLTFIERLGIREKATHELRIKFDENVFKNS